MHEEINRTHARSKVSRRLPEDLLLFSAEELPLSFFYLHEFPVSFDMVHKGITGAAAPMNTARNIHYLTIYEAEHTAAFRERKGLAEPGFQ